ncbi:MAG TPA: hypothetical protein PLG90_07110 [Ignavibacteria bacterium]|nr:hypothetical protein [Ignavibacteria bacterium]
MEVLIQYIYSLTLRELLVPEYIFMYRSFAFFHNFLIMNTYRKLFYKCYWNNDLINKSSKFKKFSLIWFSVVISIFLSFFYAPSDPANSKSSSATLYLYRFAKNLFSKISDFLNHTVNSLNKVLNLLINRNYSFIAAESPKNLAMINCWRI